MQRTRRSRTRVLLATTTLALLAGGRAGPPALAQDVDPVTLRLAVADQQGRPSTPAVDAFVAAVNELSGGSLTIETIWDAAAGSELGREQGAIQRLVDGEAELVLAASRAWDGMGMDAFRALQTPFLIDDDALAVAVTESDVATTMLDSLSAHGISGLAVWPEDLRHPAAVFDCVEPIVAPEQLAGLTVRVAPSGVAYDLFETLGATPLWEEWDGCVIQATESGLQQGLSFPGPVAFTGDVTLYPKFQVLAADRAALERLADGQRKALGDAAKRAHDAAIAARIGDAQAAEDWCAQGGRVVLAGPEGTAAFQAAAQPVYERLEADPLAAQAIAAITALKATVARAPAPGACGEAAAPAEPIYAATGPTPIDGTYVTHISFEELRESPLLYDRAEINDDNWGDVSMTFDEGMLTFTLDNPVVHYESSGEYDVEGDLLTINDPNACCPQVPFSFRWQLDGDTLTLSRDPAYVGPTSYIIKPWTKVAGD